MAGNEYPTARRLFALADHLDRGGSLSVAWIREHLRAARSTADDYLEFLKVVRGLVASGEGEARTWRLPSRPAEPRRLDEALAITLGRVAMSGLRGTRVFRSLDALARPIQQGISQTDFDTLTRVGQAYRRLIKPEVPAPRAEAVDHLIEAIHAMRRCRLVYRDLRGRDTRREVEPWSLFEHRDIVYLFANSLPERHARIFDVDGIAAVEPLDSHFRPPVPLPDVGDLVQRAVGIFLTDAPPERVEVLTRGWVAEHLLRRPLHPSQRHEAVGEDLVRIELQVQVTPDLVGLLLSYAPDARPTRPAALVAEFDRRHRGALPALPASDSAAAAPIRSEGAADAARTEQAVATRPRAR